MVVRDFCDGEEAALRSVFFSSVHELASGNYSPEQLEAWAPREYNENDWVERMRDLRPFVAEVDDCVAGYAALQASGYIDHFYVAASYARRGVGNALMEGIHQAARQRPLVELWTDASLTAEPFFRKWNFVAESRRSVVVRGVGMFNVRMRKQLLT
jgi:putative acetyltransferase